VRKVAADCTRIYCSVERLLHRGGQNLKRSDIVLTCRVRIQGDDLKVDYYPMTTKEISMIMLTNRGS
jgi:hypothetical protein